MAQLYWKVKTIDGNWIWVKAIAKHTLQWKPACACSACADEHHLWMKEDGEE